MNSITRGYVRLFESAKTPKDKEKFFTDVREDLAKKTVQSGEFSIQGLWDHLVSDSHGAPCGREIRESWVPEGGYDVVALQEAGMGGVTTAAFTNIVGQLFYNEVMETWNSPEWISDRLGKTVDTNILDGEKIGGISAVGDDAESIPQNQPYPITGITERWVETPRPVKRGHILPLNREVILSDKTNQLMGQAETISRTMRMNKEKRCVDTAMGVNNTWKRNGSSATATYNDSTTAPHDFDNLYATNPLVDYTNVENAMELFDAMVEPETGEPIVITPPFQMLVPTSLLYTARRIVNATEIRHASTNTTTISANPLNTPNMPAVPVQAFEILASPYVQLRITASSSVGDNTIASNTWYVGNFMRAFRYMQIWPMSVTPMPRNAEWEFQRDIVMAWKVSEFGVPAVIEPRYVVKNTVA